MVEFMIGDATNVSSFIQKWYQLIVSIYFLQLIGKYYFILQESFEKNNSIIDKYKVFIKNQVYCGFKNNLILLIINLLLVINMSSATNICAAKDRNGNRICNNSNDKW